MARYDTAGHNTARYNMARCSMAGCTTKMYIAAVYDTDLAGYHSAGCI